MFAPRPPVIAALLAAAAFTATLVPASANAAFSGSNGKMAWATDGKLQVDDPYDDGPPVTIATVPKAENPLNALAPTSAVSWSPDGTKIAFVQAIDDGIFPDKTAIFVADVSEKPGGGIASPVPIRRISNPYPGRPRSCGVCEDGEDTYDFAPVWTPEGDVAFIRNVYADDQAPHVSEEGSSVIVAPVESGESGTIAHWNPKSHGLMQSIIWPQGASEPVAIAATASGFQLKRVASLQVIAQEYGIRDVDASPDGSRLVYEAIQPGGPRIKVVRASSGEKVYEFAPAFTDMGVRYAPDGTRLIMGGCSKDRAGNQHCGWKTHRIPDPDADVRDTDPVEEPYLDGNPSWGIGPSSGAGGRSTIDIQSQDLPIIFAPGFLGSEIVCGGEKVWMPSIPPIRLDKIAMAADGKSEAACPGAAPTGKEVDSFLGADVYGHATDWFKAIKAKAGDPDGWYTMGWDWRKSPQESVQRVDEQITRLLKQDLPRRQGAKRAAFATHSYGSLLVRTYLDDPVKAKRVARVVTVGAPWWGAPKPVFPIAFGIESPDFSALDLMISNTDLKTFITNAGGAYHLAPSDSYGQWLRFDGERQDQGGVSRFLGSVGGNEALFAAARTTHQKIDGFKDYGGKIDFRSVTGIGLPTVEKVSVVPQGDGDATIGLFFGQGDGTVPGFSATQGEVGTNAPLGDPVHIQYRCGVPHMRQTADEFTQRAYSDFLVSGAIPRKMPHTNCPISGQLIKVFHNVAMGQPTPQVARAGGPKSLEDADFAHEVDVIRLPGQTTIVTSDSIDQPVAFDAQGSRFEISALSDAGEGAPRTYGPVTGRVVLGGTAASPVVTVNGQPLAGEVAGGPVAGGGGPSGGGGAGGTGGGPVAPAPTPQPDTLLAKVLVGKLLRADAKGRITVKVSAKAASTGTLTLKDRRGRALAKPVKVRLRKAGTVSVRVTLTKAARAKARRGKLAASLTVSLTAAPGRASVATAVTALRAR